MDEKKEKREKGNGSTVYSELNLERWNIFTTQKKKGMRVLKREIQLPDGRVERHSVQIGVEGSVHTLTTESATLFYGILDLFDIQGRPESGEVATTVNHLLNRIVQSNTQKERKEVRRGNWSKIWLKRLTKIMETTVINYEESWEDKGGNGRRSESFTLLNGSEFYDRKKDPSGKRSGLTIFKIHPVIVRSIIAKHIKPIRFDVFLSLKRENSKVLYRHLDLMLSERDHYEKDIKNLSEELDIGAERFDKLLSQMRDWCEELEGKDISTGRLVKCRIERRVENLGWKLVAHKGKQLKQLPPPLVPQDPVIDDRKPLAEFEVLSEEEKHEVLKLRDEILKERYGNNQVSLSKEMALIDAMSARLVGGK